MVVQKYKTKIKPTEKEQDSSTKGVFAQAEATLSPVAIPYGYV